MWTVNCYPWRRVRRLSKAELPNLSWRDLAMKLSKSLEDIKGCKRAVAERNDRNKGLERFQNQDLMNRQMKLDDARTNVRLLRSEIERRGGGDFCIRISAQPSGSGPSGSNVVPFAESP